LVGSCQARFPKNQAQIVFLDGNWVQLTALALRGARTTGWTLRGVAED
jgi:hypothetical protein